MKTKDFSSQAQKLGVSVLDINLILSNQENVNQITELKEENEVTLTLCVQMRARSTSSSETEQQVIVVQQEAVNKPQRNNFLNNLVYLLLFFAIIGLAVYITLNISGSGNSLGSLYQIIMGGNKAQGCGVPNSTLLEFVESGDTIRPVNVPSLTDDESYLCFQASQMNEFYKSQLTLENGKKVDGKTVIISMILSETAKKQNKIQDTIWIGSLYNSVAAAMDPRQFKNAEKPAGFMFVVLPGIIGPVAERENKTVSTATPTSMIYIIPPATITPQPTMQPTATNAGKDEKPASTKVAPTNIPQPTLAQARATLAVKLATSAAVYKVTPSPFPTHAKTPTPQGVLSLDWYIANELAGGGACSPDSRSYFEIWPPMDNMVYLVIGVQCLDNVGRSSYVQFPADTIKRHVSDARYPQIFLSQYPLEFHGPAMKLPSGYYLQPFQ